VSRLRVSFSLSISGFSATQDEEVYPLDPFGIKGFSQLSLSCPISPFDPSIVRIISF
jgi:hypothetical protein